MPIPAVWATMAARSAASTPTPWYLNTTLGIAMLCGRFLMLIPLLAAAGSLGAKKLVAGLGWSLPYRPFPRCSSFLLVGVVVIVGALSSSSRRWRSALSSSILAMLDGQLF